jgi:hypothetical protein
MCLLTQQFAKFLGGHAGLSEDARQYAGLDDGAAMDGDSHVAGSMRMVHLNVVTALSDSFSARALRRAQHGSAGHPR